MPVIGGGAAANFAKRATGVRLDPYAGSNFLVELDGLIAGGYAEVSGMDLETGVENFREGGLNTMVHSFPSGTSAGQLRLSKGISSLDMVWRWYTDVTQGKIVRRNATIYLLGIEGLPRMWWNVYDAFPVRWEGPSLSAGATNVATEALYFNYTRLERVGL